MGGVLFDGGGKVVEFVGSFVCMVCGRSAIFHTPSLGSHEIGFVFFMGALSLPRFTGKGAFFLRQPHRGDLRATFGQCAGFVEDDGINARRFFHRRRVLVPDAVPHRLAHADHNRGGRGKAEGAGAGDDQYRDRVHQRGCRVALQRPGEGEGGNGNGNHRRHEDGGGAVGNTGDGRLAALRFGECRHHVAKQGLATELFGAINQAAVAHQGASQYAAAGRFRFRPRFAGQMAFVCPAAAAFHDAVGGDAFAVVGAQQVADLYLIQRHGLPTAVALAAYLARGELQQEAEAVQAGFFAALLQVFAERDEADDHHPRFKIDVAVAVRRAHHVERVEVNRAGAEGDQHVHVGKAAFDTRPGAFV